MLIASIHAAEAVMMLAKQGATGCMPFCHGSSQFANVEKLLLLWKWCLDCVCTMGHPVALQRKCILAQIYDSSKCRKKNYSYTMATRWRRCRHYYTSMRQTSFTLCFQSAFVWHIGPLKWTRLLRNKVMRLLPYVELLHAYKYRKVSISTRPWIVGALKLYPHPESTNVK